jgi:hypothetical protein
MCALWGAERLQSVHMDGQVNCPEDVAYIHGWVLYVIDDY